MPRPPGCNNQPFLREAVEQQMGGILGGRRAIRESRFLSVEPGALQNRQPTILFT